MRKVKWNALRFACVLIFGWQVQTSTAQSVPVKHSGVNINSNCFGYLEYLPPDYDTNTAQKHPLLLFFNGHGTQGSGSAADLEVFFNGGGTPPEQCRLGWWVPGFTTAGVYRSFIVITPQFVRPFCCQAMPTAQEVDDIINYMVLHYKVDLSRIYLTGVSSGGYIPFEYAAAGPQYANRIAAIAPFAATSWGNQAKANVIRNGNVAVWGFHNIGDVAPPPITTIDWINMINTPTPAPTEAKMTIFPVYGSHICWWDTYLRNYTEGGLNLYQWMLQFSKTPAGGPLPVKFDLVTAACQNGGTTLTWTTSVEINTNSFSIEKSADGTEWKSLAEIKAQGINNAGHNYAYFDKNNGRYVYRIVANDLDGRKTFSAVIKGDCGQPKEFSMYPNPVLENSVLQISLNESARVQLNIIDSKGALVLQEQKLIPRGNNQVPLHLQFLPKGLYTLHANWNQERRTVKFVKM